MTRGQERYSLVAIRISTGRRHQIRAHLAHAGHPVVCDAKYGGKQLEAGEKSGAERYQQDLQWCPRNFLHRYRVAWVSDQNPHEAHAELPGDLKEALAQLSPKVAAGKVCHTSAVQLQWLLEENGLKSAEWAQLPILDSLYRDDAD